MIVMKLGAVFVRRAGERAVSASPAGVLAASGGMDATTLVVQVVRRRGSDLVLFDLRTHRRREPPNGVNTRAWEWRGSISGDRLLFGRFDGAGTYEVILLNLATGREHRLDSVSGHGAYAEPGQLNGRYAVWAGCPDNFCTIYRYDVLTGKRRRVPGDYGHSVAAPSVSRRGVVYYERGGLSCGSQATLMRYRPGSAPRVVATLAPGYDFRFSSASDRRVLIDRVSCKHGNFDVYGVTVNP